MTTEPVADQSPDPDPHPEPDDPFWDAWRGIIFAHARIYHSVGQSLQEHSGITLPVIDVLARLHDAPDHRLRMQEIQDRSLFTYSGMTRLVDRIERAGLVRRESVPGDRRGVAVVLTDEGARIYGEAMARHRADVEREFGRRLTVEQHRAVADGLASFWRDQSPPQSDENRP